MSEVKIEHNVAVPDFRGKWTQVLQQMKPGDSVVIPATVISTFYSASKRLGIKICTRKEKGGKSVRAWRVEGAVKTSASKSTKKSAPAAEPATANA